MAVSKLQWQTQRCHGSFNVATAASKLPWQIERCRSSFNLVDAVQCCDGGFNVAATASTLLQRLQRCHGGFNVASQLQPCQCSLTWPRQLQHPTAASTLPRWLQHCHSTFHEARRPFVNFSQLSMPSGHLPSTSVNFLCGLETFSQPRSTVCATGRPSVKFCKHFV